MLFLQACLHKPKGSFIENGVPTPPNYSESKYWSALPDMEDTADKTPNTEIKNLQETADADVFFLHPTIYNGSKKTHKNCTSPSAIFMSFDILN